MDAYHACIEFRLLQCLMCSSVACIRCRSYRGSLPSYRMLSRCTPDGHIRNRRRKLEVFGGDPIQSVYGMGIRWEGTTSPA